MIKTLALAAVALLAVACTGRGTLEKEGGIALILSFADSAASDEAKNHAAEVVWQRMDAAGVRNPVSQVAPDGKGIIVELPGADSLELFSALATSPGRFEIVECYAGREVGDLPGLLPRQYTPVHPELPLPSAIGFKLESERAEFERWATSDSVAQALPHGARLALLNESYVSTDGEPAYSMIVLRYAASGRAPITGDMVEVARAAKTGYGDDYAVNILFAKPFHDTWARLTRDNIGSLLAIVIDGEPLAAPTVHDEIVGGRVQITGGFMPEKARFIAAILSGGELPVPLTVSHSAVVKPDAQ